MSRPVSEITPVGRTVRLLLRAARQRAQSRVGRMRQLQQVRTGKRANNTRGLLIALAFIIAAILHLFFIYGLYQSVEMATRMEVASHGRIVVSEHFFEDAFGKNPDVGKAVGNEASRQQRDLGRDRAQTEAALKDQLAQGEAGFMHEKEMRDQMRNVAAERPLTKAATTLMLLWWFAMLVCAGEGIELDFQRRRHPIWEWLLSHPVRPGAAFFSEMIAPMAANPIYVTAPLLFIALLWPFYSPLGAILGGLVMGWPVALAACFLNKAIEIAAMLCLPPRSRGTVLGLVSWFGQVAFLGVLVILQEHMVEALLKWLKPAASWLALPLLPWLVGARADGNYSLLRAILTGWAIAGAIGIFSIWLSARATNRGLQGVSGDKPVTPSFANALAAWPFLRDPLFRKEILWFCRDRGTVIQAILIPLTIGAIQVFNNRRLTEHIVFGWNTVCGFAIIWGTYFLLMIGPRSLVSEGPALWITLTWPRGLESLLKAKARLWALLANLMIGIIMVFTAIRFPADAWKIALVTLAWVIFAHNLSEKAVTLVPSTSSSGEPEPMPPGRQWAAFLGTFAFASGVFVQNWYLAAIGVIFSTLTAAAMWQNFRARLPFLFDPWSEKPPMPPTLMHAMIAITGMVEGMALISVPVFVLLGSLGLPTNDVSQAIARAVAYGGAATLAWWFTSRFLANAGVPSGEVWRWVPPNPRSGETPVSLAKRARTLLLGAACGVLTGFAALGYTFIVLHIPLVGEKMGQSLMILVAHPVAHWITAIIAIGMAPFAEEYLFRGLLYRALDREWGGWPAIFGSAVFFGLYHPPLSWLPVTALGVVNACLFKRTGWLWPCVLAHIAYNAVVILAV